MRLERSASLLLGSLLVAACSGHGERVLRVSTRTPVTSLDPQATDDYATLQVFSHVYEPLVVFDNDGRIVPHLAASWVNPSDRTWRFELRRGVRFQDGRPLTADDVKFTLDRGRSLPDSWIRQNVPLLDRANVLDDHTVELVTTSPAPLLLNQITAVLILPRGSDPSRTSLGTGPYRLVRRSEDGSEVVLERIDRHWRSRPFWDSAVFRTQADGRLRLDDVLEGRADIAEAPRVEDIPRLLGSPGAQLLQQVGLAVAILGFEVEAGPFSDPLVRHALLLALDRRALVRDVLGGWATPATQLAPPGVFGYVPDLAYVEQDVQAARSALALSRFPGGFSETLYLTERDASVARFVARAAAALGIHLDLREVAWAELDRLMSARQAPAYILHMTFPNFDTSDILTWAFHTRMADRRYGLLNFSGYSDPTLDRVLEESERELSSRRRYDLLRRSMEAAVASRVWLPLCVPAQVFAARKGLAWEGNPTGRIRLDEIGEAEGP